MTSDVTRSGAPAIRRRSHYAIILEVAVCHKDKTVTSQGQIDPALLPLLTGASNQILTYQGQNPISGYGAPQQQPIAGISPIEQYGMGAVPNLFNTPRTDALALQAIMRMPGAAGAGPTTGRENLSGLPSLSALYGLVQNPVQAYTPAASSTAPIGPLPDTSYNYDPTAPGGPDYHPPPSTPGPVPQDPTAPIYPNDPDLPPDPNYPQDPTAPIYPTASTNRTVSPRYMAATTGQTASGYTPGSSTYDWVAGSNPAHSLSVGGAGLPNVMKEYGYLASAPGEWKYGYGPHGGPILPGYGEYTGAQHEWGGMFGGENASKAEAVKAAGMTPKDVAAWLQTGLQAFSPNLDLSKSQAGQVLTADYVYGGVKPGMTVEEAANLPGAAPTTPASRPVLKTTTQVSRPTLGTDLSGTPRVAPNPTGNDYLLQKYGVTTRTTKATPAVVNTKVATRGSR